MVDNSAQNSFSREVTSIVEKIAILDKALVVPGAKSHKYSFNRCVSEDTIVEFEHRYEFSIPCDYRKFIIELGNGGAGPLNGVEPLELNATNLADDFPYDGPYRNRELDFWPPILEDYHERPISGGLLISKELDYRGDYFVILVLNGPFRGQIWYDCRANEVESSVVPIADSFQDWWMDGMKPILGEFELIYEKMKSATELSKIIQIANEARANSKSDIGTDLNDIILSIMGHDPYSFDTVGPAKSNQLIEEAQDRWVGLNEFSSYEPSISKQMDDAYKTWLEEVNV